jgi:3-oxoadipate enol-lactonase
MALMETQDEGRSGLAPVDGGRLYYEVVGAGPSVVLVHAGMWDSRMWEPQMAAFAANHRVLSYDLRGFGSSDRLGGPFSHRQDLADLMANLGIASAAVVGCSVGGSFALDFTIERPQMVAIASSSIGAAYRHLHRWPEASSSTTCSSSHPR